MQAFIEPGRTKGEAVTIPASKSISHRVLIAAALADGISEIHHLVHNDDTLATIRCLEKLGASFEEKENVLVVHGIHDFSAYDGSVIDCSESGSTLRFLIPLFSLSEKKTVFTGHGRLMQRPQDIYRDLYQKQGLLFEQEDHRLITQGMLNSGCYELKGNVSSQFISGLLFALPLLKNDSTIQILPPYESRSYVILTEQVLKEAGIHIEDEGMIIHIPGGQHYQPGIRTIPGDDSQAAFFAELAMVTGISTEVKGVSHDSLQGDHVLLQLVEHAGGTCVPVKDGYQFVPGSLHGFQADLKDCPDLGPALFAMATQCEGTSVFTGCERLRIKESDRIACMEEELRKLGAEMESDGDTVVIKGKKALHGGVMLNGHGDHRIVMALASLVTCADQGTWIDGAEAVNKSYPDFFKDLEKAGVKVKLK